MYTLATFYNSDQWRALLAALKNERLDDDGQIICEHCGQPIVKAYDIIGHHKEPLTEENVNDFNISLNPGNIQFVHHVCHNKIHHKLEGETRYKLTNSMRQVFLVYGPPLSGKTSWVKRSMNEGDLVIDIDSIWECVSGCDRYVKPKRLNAVVFRIRDALLDAVKYRMGKWENAYVIGGYAMQSERERLCKELGARQIYVEATQKECHDRLEGSGRDAEKWGEYIDAWFRLYIPPASA